jgi:hypothetical protein
MKPRATWRVPPEHFRRLHGMRNRQAFADAAKPSEKLDDFWT